jgi:hypothetical protein
MHTLFTALISGNPTLPQAIVFGALVFGVVIGGARLVDAGIDVYRAIKGKTDRDVEELALAIEELARTVRDVGSDQLGVLHDIANGIDQVQETVLEIADYSPVDESKRQAERAASI